MKQFRVIIAGSRGCPQYSEELFEKISELTGHMPPSDMEIVSGTAFGADRLGENYANKYGIQIKRFPPDWNKYGKAAGPIRNKEMSQYGTHLIALHNGKSPGTSNMIELAKQHGLQIAIIEI